MTKKKNTQITKLQFINVVLLVFTVFSFKHCWEQQQLSKEGLTDDGASAFYSLRPFEVETSSFSNVQHLRRYIFCIKWKNNSIHVHVCSCSVYIYTQLDPLVMRQIKKKVTCTWHHSQCQTGVGHRGCNTLSHH